MTPGYPSAKQKWRKPPVGVPEPAQVLGLELDEGRLVGLGGGPPLVEGGELRRGDEPVEDLLLEGVAPSQAGPGVRRLSAMEILSSRVLLRPVDFERSFRFYAHTLGLHVYREWGTEEGRGVVFFLGGGFLELSGRGGRAADDKVSLWLQVRDVDAAHAALTDPGLAGSVEVVEAPVDKPWGLRELRIRDPDGVLLVLVQVPEGHPLRRDHRG